MALTEKLTNIANAIRTKTGSTSQMTLTDMAVAINNIETGTAPSTYSLWADGTWAEINEVLTGYYNGQITNLDNYFKLGQVRTIHVNATSAYTNTSIEAQEAKDVEFMIIGIAHDDLVTATDSGVTKSAITVLSKDVFLESVIFSKKVNSSHSYAFDTGSYLDNNVYNAIECKDYIKTVSKGYVYAYKTYSTTTYTEKINTENRKIFILNSNEIYGETILSKNGLTPGSQYEYDLTKLISWGEYNPLQFWIRDIRSNKASSSSTSYIQYAYYRNYYVTDSGINTSNTDSKQNLIIGFCL